MTVADRHLTIEWLLEPDAAIRWQVLRGLTDAPSEEVAAERARIARGGWGAQLLAAQDGDGRWGGGTFMPRGLERPTSTSARRSAGRAGGSRSAGFASSAGRDEGDELVTAIAPAARVAAHCVVRATSQPRFEVEVRVR
jgi:hypothetical protein